MDWSCNEDGRNEAESYHRKVVIMEGEEEEDQDWNGSKGEDRASPSIVESIGSG